MVNIVIHWTILRLFPLQWVGKVRVLHERTFTCYHVCLKNLMIYLLLLKRLWVWIEHVWVHVLLCIAQVADIIETARVHLSVHHACVLTCHSCLYELSPTWRPRYTIWCHSFWAKSNLPLSILLCLFLSRRRLSFTIEFILHVPGWVNEFLVVLRHELLWRKDKLKVTQILILIDLSFSLLLCLQCFLLFRSDLCLTFDGTSLEL